MTRAESRDTSDRGKQVALSLVHMACALLDDAGEPSAAARLRDAVADLEAERSGKLRQVVWRTVREDDRRALDRAKASTPDD